MSENLRDERLNEAARHIIRMDARLGKDRWYSSGPPWGDHGYVYAGSDDPHAGDFISTSDDGLFFDEDDSTYESFPTPEERAKAIAMFRNYAPALARAYLEREGE